MGWFLFDTPTYIFDATSKVGMSGQAIAQRTANNLNLKDLFRFAPLEVLTTLYRLSPLAKPMSHSLGQHGILENKRPTLLSLGLSLVKQRKNVYTLTIESVAYTTICS